MTQQDLVQRDLNDINLVHRLGILAEWQSYMPQGVASLPLSACVFIDTCREFYRFIVLSFLL